MTFTYPAVFTEKEDGTGYHAFFPDLEMCEADGADLEDAIENARDAAQNWISVELEEFEGDLPFATHVDDIELADVSPEILRRSREKTWNLQSPGRRISRRH